MNLELTRDGILTPKDVAGNPVASWAHLYTHACSGALRAAGSLLLFLVARPLVRRLNLGM